eukprot:782335-Amphidinium_carterae.1
MLMLHNATLAQVTTHESKGCMKHCTIGQLLKVNSTVQFRMVAEPRFTMREGPGAMDDRETVEEYNEETKEIDNVYE